MFLEKGIVYGRYETRHFNNTDSEKNSEGNHTVWVNSKDKGTEKMEVVKSFTYNVAIGQAGKFRKPNTIKY